MIRTFATLAAILLTNNDKIAQLCLAPSMLLGRKIAHQQLMTAEYYSGQKTVAPVIAVKEATVLFTVYRVIGRIEVQYQLFRCTLERAMN